MISGKTIAYPGWFHGARTPVQHGTLALGFLAMVGGQHRIVGFRAVGGCRRRNAQLQRSRVLWYVAAKTRVQFKFTVATGAITRPRKTGSQLRSDVNPPKLR